MRTDREMPLDIGDYLSDTMHLSRSEHGSYLMLIMAYWKNGGPLPNDDPTLRHIAMCPESDWARTKGIMERFFDCSNGTWRHKRIEEELAKERKRKEDIARASAAGVEKRRELGQIAPQPSVGPAVHPPVSGAAGVIRAEKELGRVEARIEEIRENAPHVAGGEIKLTLQEREEIKSLKARKAELIRIIGFRV